MPKIGSNHKAPSVLDEALRLHAFGLWVVPVAGRQPVVAGYGEHRLSEDDLRAYLAERLWLGIAIVLSQSDLMDVETDSEEGARRLEELLNGGAHTPTWRSRRGLHRLYKRPPGLPKRAKVEVEGIEFRIGNNTALTTVPPSRHREGMLYAWLPGLSIWEITAAPLPTRLEELLLRGVKSGKATGSAKAMQGLLVEGQRNDELFRYGCRLLRDGGSDGDIRNAIIGCNKDQCLPPLSDAEVDGIIKSLAESKARRAAAELGPLECASWEELIAAWDSDQGGALLLTDQIRMALAVCLAVCLSTEQQGDNQLFLQLIADAGSAKTKLCDAMLVAKRYCYPLEHLTGFHSGWRDSSGDDFSLLSRINKMTLITPEGDVLMSSPRFVEIMSQQRRIFDGTSGASYKNRKDDLRWEGLRTPWIMAGTPALLAVDQARLGDRFLRFVIDAPGQDQRRAILRHVILREQRTVRITVDGVPESVVEEKMLRAYRLTGGMVDRLRRNAEKLLNGLLEPAVEVVERIADLAEFAADFRARPDISQRLAERHDTKELPTRLAGQFMRLASCLAVVLDREQIDGEVLEIVKKVSLDTARGRTMELARRLLPLGRDGAETRTLAGWLGEGEDRALTLLRFMRASQIGVLEAFEPASSNGVCVAQRWRLTERAERLCQEVLQS